MKALTSQGLTMSAASWARMPWIPVDRSTITRRKQKGWSDADCLRTPKGSSVRASHS